MRSAIGLIRDTSPQRPPASVQQTPPKSTSRPQPQPYNAPGAGHTVTTLTPQASGGAYHPAAASQAVATGGNQAAWAPVSNATTNVLSPLPLISDRPVDPRMTPSMYRPQQAGGTDLKPGSSFK